MPKRIMIVHKEKCNPQGCGGYLCTRVSPSNRAGKDAIVKSDDGKVEVNENVISDVDRIAANKCPFGALQMVNLPAELDEDPIHRYGKNGFALFQLPIPIFGKVVGIVGRNGIGKTTALQVIAGLLKPNLGQQEKEATYDELSKRYRGSEAQQFFEKLDAGSITVAYKPQQVDMIPKQFKGTTRQLLEKVDERGKLEEISEALDLEKLLDRNVEHLSGGELQRVAIAATVVKKANLYLFDEPTSYLDIKQRLKTAAFIRNLADEDTAVMVIEHDLIIMDAMTDLVHLMYGTPGAFGVVSQPYSTKAGINIYLQGYLPQSNVRFREKAIRFERHPPSEAKGREVLTSWDGFTHQLGEFTLESSEGTIRKHDVIGILGENGIGKTSLVKVLAGQIDAGVALDDLDISYKPQYLGKSDDLVITYLQEAGAMKHENQLVKPLDLKPLYEKTLSQLSGGELQRVAIAACLARDADLYLMDEPSAYLDVEQRLTISKVVEDMMVSRGKSALIVDHDLLFLDYLSSGLMVFDGEPAIRGKAEGPYAMEEGMNSFLKDVEITFRRDEESGRPRVNKPGSQKDQEQKKSGKLYYT
ncbi:ribosome biogenesis/translation initiation ATPase RLI [Candidatus Woesearchaeota archaeon]|nr:ribosome biogenesis/translation initiation ATPase RLI [Candidatus Woesearchaeota archaeon]